MEYALFLQWGVKVIYTVIQMASDHHLAIKTWYAMTNDTVYNNVAIVLSQWLQIMTTIFLTYKYVTTTTFQQAIMSLSQGEK